MTAHAVPPYKTRRRTRGLLALPFVLTVVLVASIAAFVSYVLRPTWPGQPTALDAPAIPITVAGVLFEVPAAAIRVAMQRQPGPHERVDLVFLWPSLAPPQPYGKTGTKPAAETPGTRSSTAAAPLAGTKDRLFVTITGLGAVLAPDERLQTIYPRYVEKQATAGADGLAVLAFRAGTPYEGEDLVYVAQKPEQFFARCTRDAGAVVGTCMRDLALDAAEITLRFPRDWLGDWRKVAAGFDRLVARLHPKGR